MSKEKFSKCGEGKNVSVKFRVFEKKNWKKSSGEKSKCFWVKVLKWKILLGSCSLFGHYVNLKVRVKEKKDENFQSIFRVGVLKLKFDCKENLKSGIFIYWVRTHWLGAMLWNMAENWNWSFTLQEKG